MGRAVGMLGWFVASAWLVAACAGPSTEPSSGTLTVTPGTTEVGPRLSAMTPAAQAVVRSANVRFLLLPAPYAAVAVATSGPHWSALSARHGELTLSLSGTDVTHAAPLTLDEVQRAEPTSRVRGVPARVLMNEGIRSVAWNEAGVDWSLEVECAQPGTDARCTEDGFLLDLASQLEEAPQ